MVRQRSSVRRGSGQRRKMVWARSQTTGVTVPTVDGIQLNLLSNFETEYGANLIGATVVRIRGAVVLAPQVAGNSSAIFAVRVSNDADATAGGGPFDSPYADWMAFEPFVTVDSGTLDPTGDSPLTGRLIDVRAQRKLEEINEQLTAWIQSANQAHTFGAHLSILLKLP